MHSSLQYNAFQSIPGLNDSVRRERLRQVSIENQHLAMRLITVKGHEIVQKKYHDKHFNEQVKIKNILCKLPVIDMSKNVFSHPEQQRSLSTKRYYTHRQAHQRSSANLSQQSGKKRRLNQSISKDSLNSRHGKPNAPKKIKIKGVKNLKCINDKSMASIDATDSKPDDQVLLTHESSNRLPPLVLTAPEELKPRIIRKRSKNKKQDKGSLQSQVKKLSDKTRALYDSFDTYNSVLLPKKSPANSSIIPTSNKGSKLKSKSKTKKEAKKIKNASEVQRESEVPSVEVTVQPDRISPDHMETQDDQDDEPLQSN